ncbi:MAG: hypothetical protein R3B09_28765 [Nannocystaceae bacterium]
MEKGADEHREDRRGIDVWAPLPADERPLEHRHRWTAGPLLETSAGVGRDRRGDRVDEEKAKIARQYLVPKQLEQ